MLVHLRLFIRIRFISCGSSSSQITNPKINTSRSQRLCILQFLWLESLDDKKSLIWQMWIKLVKHLNETPGSIFPILASTGIKNSEMCPWLLRGEGDPGHTWNKAKANLIMMSFIQRWRGDKSCPLNVTEADIKPKAVTEGQSIRTRRSNREGMWSSEQQRTDKMNLSLRRCHKDNESLSYNIFISLKEVVDV